MAPQTLLPPVNRSVLVAGRSSLQQILQQLTVANVQAKCTTVW